MDHWLFRAVNTSPRCLENKYKMNATDHGSKSTSMQVCSFIYRRGNCACLDNAHREVADDRRCE